MRRNSVVPIGGAPFVHPYSLDQGVGSSSSTSSGSSMYSPSNSSPSSAAHSPVYHTPLLYRRSRGPSLGEALPPPLEPLGGPDASYYYHSSSTPYYSRNSEHFQAALAYSFALHEHTRKMWENERAHIEKSKFSAATLQQSSGGSSQGDLNLAYTKRRASAAAAPVTSNKRVATLQEDKPRRSSLGSAFNVDGLLARSKRRRSKAKVVF